jgi:hypothetical protein
VIAIFLKILENSGDPVYLIRGKYFTSNDVVFVKACVISYCSKEDSPSRIVCNSKVQKLLSNLKQVDDVSNLLDMSVIRPYI